MPTQKESYYFSHDYNARNDLKMVKLRSRFGAEGYGIFWMLVEIMAENKTTDLALSDTEALAFNLNVPEGKLDDLIQFCIEVDLFSSDGQYITSQRLQNHKAERSKLSQTRSNTARIRWAAGTSDAIALQTDAKERKGNKGKERKSVAITAPQDQLTDHTKRFSAPSVQDVRAYFETIGLNGKSASEAGKFVDFYITKNWKVGKNPMKDWQAACRNWKRRMDEEAGQGSATPEPVKVRY